MDARRMPVQPDDWPTSTGTEPDYTDAFEVLTPASRDRPAEAWMRSALEDAPSSLRWFIQLGWRFVLGFHKSDETNVLGWPVTVVAPDWIVLEQESALLAAALLVRRGPDRLTWQTRIHYKKAAAPIVWIVVGIIHRRIVPYVLTRAAAEHR